MPQITNWTIANSGGSTYRAAVNTALAAIQSSSSGTAAPSPTVAGMLWYDTTNSILKRRNTANTAWVDVSLDTIAANTLRGNPTGAAAAETAVSVAQLQTMLGFDLSIGSGASGYQIFPGGMIMQWGAVTAAITTGSTITLPIAFPTAVRAILTTAVSTTALSITHSSPTTSNFLINGWNAAGASAAVTGRFIAIGF